MPPTQKKRKKTFQILCMISSMEPALLWMTMCKCEWRKLKQGDRLSSSLFTSFYYDFNSLHSQYCRNTDRCVQTVSNVIKSVIHSCLFTVDECLCTGYHRLRVLTCRTVNLNLFVFDSQLVSSDMSYGKLPLFRIIQ